MVDYQSFWAAGFRVFGLHTVTPDGNCGCGNPQCKMAGKHPAAGSWQHTPEWSLEQLETMEEMGQFRTGFGIRVFRLLVIDVDARNGGVQSYERLLNDFPAIERAGLIVRTGSGGGSKHIYFSLPEGLALVQHHADYPGIDFKSSGYVVGPGSLHKSGATYEIEYGSPDDIEDTPPELIALLAKPERHRAEFDGRVMDVSHGDLAGMLAHVVNADLDYETWIRIGMALHHATGGTGFDLWDDWSRTSKKYDAREMQKKWFSFGKSANPVTLGTLVHYAEQGGWEQSVTFEPEIEFEDVPEPPADVADTEIDLKRPPGFVGELAQWIEAQSRRPREILSVGMALMAVGNIIGLRYTDDVDNVSSNLVAFCVAGSGTGKDSAQKALSQIHLAAGLSGATYGTIKSEQEIIRNLTTHQASFYIVDEVSHFLKKIKNAQAKGGAAYLDGIIGVLMSIYTKSDSILLLTGDMKKEIRRQLLQEYKQIENQIDEDPSKATPLAGALSGIKQQLEMINEGLRNPFLSMAGFSTKEQFYDLMDFEAATNGFIGRSLIFLEPNDAPASKKKFRKAPMSDRMERTLASLYMAGEFNAEPFQRIEYYRDKIQIPSTPGAAALLEEVNDWLDEQADAQSSTTGLSALYLRGYEMIAKISLILAAPGGLRTEEHVRWARAMVRRDIEDKARLVVANDRQKDAPQIALRMKIESLISSDAGETFGVICARMRGKEKTTVQRALDALVKEGRARCEEVQNKYNKSRTVRYWLVRDA